MAGEYTATVLEILEGQKRLAKRLESTEAQIRKLFARTEENMTIQPSLPLKDLIPEEIPILSQLSNMVINCGSCHLNFATYRKTFTRRMRMEAGHVVRICFTGQCPHCHSKVVVEL